MSYDNSTDFFRRYLEITGGTEVPAFFRRWAILTGVGAWIGRSACFKRGSFKIYPNMYVMLLGAPGTRKSTAIKDVKKILQRAGYTSFAAEKTTKEKFLMDLAGVGEEYNAEGFLNLDLGSTTTECLIAADEFSDFFGNNIMDFVSTLGVLWDYEGIYKSRIKNGVQVELSDPTISILSGNTQTTFANTFPPEVMGQGFFSRMVAVYTEATTKKVTFPPAPSPEDLDYIITHLYSIQSITGNLEITEEAENLVDRIYKTWTPIPDDRFAHYGNRRLGHLLKLVIIHCVARLSNVIEARDVTYANTVLYHTEHYMPKAFGEFGRAKNASVTHKILGIIEGKLGAVDFSELWANVSTDLPGLGELGDILRGLAAAGKIQPVDGGFMACKKVLDLRYDEMVDYRYLTKAEIEGE